MFVTIKVIDLLMESGRQRDRQPLNSNSRVCIFIAAGICFQDNRPDFTSIDQTVLVVACYC